MLKVPRDPRDQRGLVGKQDLLDHTERRGKSENLGSQDTLEDQGTRETRGPRVETASSETREREGRKA